MIWVKRYRDEGGKLGRLGTTLIRNSLLWWKGRKVFHQQTNTYVIYHYPLGWEFTTMCGPTKYLFPFWKFSHRFEVLFILLLFKLCINCFSCSLMSLQSDICLIISIKSPTKQLIEVSLNILQYVECTSKSDVHNTRDSGSSSYKFMLFWIICQYYPHLLDCLLCSHVVIVWIFVIIFIVRLSFCLLVTTCQYIIDTTLNTTYIPKADWPGFDSKVLW